MEVKRKSPNHQAGRTGVKCTGKDTKRKRITQYKLAWKWKTTHDILSMERSLV